MRQVLTLLLILAVAVPVTAERYNTPTLDGHVTVGYDDWDISEWAVDDSPYDCRWGNTDPDLDDLYITWDYYALYVGITTTNLPSIYGNGYLLFIDADGQNGITGATDFTDADFYPRHITFSTMGADVLFGIWNLDMGDMGIRHCSDPTNTTPLVGTYIAVDPWWMHIELGIPWVGLYGIGDGQVPPGTTLRFIAAVVGGPTSGAYDAMPTSSTGFETDPANAWYEYTDLDVFYEVCVDADGDGVPDSEATPVESTSWSRIKGMFAR
jgi:hypothetical protein